MGNSQTYDPKNYILVGPVKNARYDIGTVYKNKDTSDFVMEKKITIQGNPAQSNQILKGYQDIKHRNLVQIFDSKQSEDAPLCGTKVQIITAYLEYLPQSLLDDVQLRVDTQNAYKESHIWYVLYNIIAPGAYLNEQGKRIGDLGLSKVLTNAKGFIKLLPQGVFPSDQTVTQRYGKQEEKYIDPEVVKKIENYDEISQEELEKNDVFSLGVMALEMMNLKTFPFNILVDKTTSDTILNQLQYQPQLLKFVGLMLAPQKSRPSFQDLFDILNLYKTQILTMQPFLMDKQAVKSQFGQPVTNIPFTPFSQQQSSMPNLMKSSQPNFQPLVPSSLNQSNRFGMPIPQQRRIPQQLPLQQRALPQQSNRPAQLYGSIQAMRPPIQQSFNQYQRPMEQLLNTEPQLKVNKKQITYDEFEQRYAQTMQQ